MTANAGPAQVASERSAFGRTRDGHPVELYTLRNAGGLTVRFMNYGGIITAIEAPDRTGRRNDITLGFTSFAEYETSNRPHFGALIGRYANRIGGAKFTLDGKEYRLAANDGPNSLHGGTRGFDKALWTVAPRQTDAGVGAVLSHVSPDGDEGYPGTLTVHVTYTLSDADELHIEYEATTDRPTVLNLTNHTYFNLAGNGSGSVADHLVQIAADYYTPVDATLIPTGKVVPVAGTPLDFRRSVPIGARLRSGFEQMVRTRGYDHNFVLNKPEGALAPAVRMHDPASGRILDVSTTEPGVQFYTGNFLDGTLAGSAGTTYRQSDGFALETQHFPDSPNRPEFPSTELRPGQTFGSRTVFRFRTDASP